MMEIKPNRKHRNVIRIKNLSIYWPQQYVCVCVFVFTFKYLPFTGNDYQFRLCIDVLVQLMNKTYHHNRQLMHRIVLIFYCELYCTVIHLMLMRQETMRLRFPIQCIQFECILYVRCSINMIRVVGLWFGLKRSNIERKGDIRSRPFATHFQMSQTQELPERFTSIYTQLYKYENSKFIKTIVDAIDISGRFNVPFE